jgi:PAS domain S-box-containing protein
MSHTSGSRSGDGPSDGSDRSSDEGLTDTQQPLPDSTEQTLLASLETVPEGIAVVDADGTLSYVNESYARMHGYARADLVGREWRILYDPRALASTEWRIHRALDREGSWRGELLGRHTDGQRFPSAVSVTRSGDGFVCLARDAGEQRTRERRLLAASRLVSQLVDADSEERIAAVALDAVEDVLGYSMAELRRYDPERDSLVLVAATETLTEAFDPPPNRLVVDTHAGKAYQVGEPVIWVGGDRAEAQTECEALSHSQTLYLPLGDYGVLGIGCDDDGFDRPTVELAEMFSSNLHVALDRYARERQLSEARAELRLRHEELLRRHETQRILLTVSVLARDIIDAVIDARSRVDIERTVCERLASSELYHFAWIGEYSPDRKQIVPRAGAGVDEGVLEEIGQIIVTDGERGAIDLAIETGQPQVVHGFADAERLHVPVRREALRRGFEAALAVPIDYRGRTYGALVVIASHQDAFGGFEQATFKLLAQLVGFAVRSGYDRDLLYADTVVEVELRSWDEGSFFVKASRVLDCRISFVGVVPEGDDAIRVYALLEGAPVERFLDLADGVETMSNIDVVDERDEDALLAVTVTGGSMVYDLVEGGVHVESVVSTHGETTLVLEVASRDEARNVVEAFIEDYPDSSVGSIRERDRPMRTRLELRNQLVDSLTEKQRNVLQSAFLEGYYDWPRRSTAAEVAARLGISSATFHQHRRLAEQKLLQALLG